MQLEGLSRAARIVLPAALVLCGVTQAQEPAPAAPPLQQQTQKIMPLPCVQPPPMIRLEDYQGKFQKIVGLLGGKLERKTVHAPHYKPGAVLCTLEPKDKLILFVHDSIDPSSFLVAGFNAGIGQAKDTDPRYGQGAEGYGKRFGASYAGRATSWFFKDFAYPSLFLEDPRYYRLQHGSGGKRIVHALGHVVVAYKENGRRMFNYSEWLGTTSGVLLSNTYHPDYKRGFVPAARRIGISFGTDIGFDLLREFWPEIARKFKLPFRGQNEPEKAEIAPARP